MPTNAQRYLVRITDQLPNNSSPLRVHCQSKDDDLGYHDLHPSESVHWEFGVNFSGSTLYFCHFWWGKKDAVFDVYTYPWSKDYCGNGLLFTNKCLWFVQEDGFYVNKIVGKHRGLTKLRSW